MYPQTRAMLAGRGRELSHLEEALSIAAAGRGQLVLLEGEPGIGKSRLADELAGRARQRGHVVLWGRSWEAAGAPPFWPWVQVLRSYVRAAPPERLRAEAGPGAAELAQLLPELGSMFPDLPPLSDTDSDSARFRLFDSTASLLRNAGTTEPLVVVLDDLHSADTPSILLLRFLASQLGEMRLLVVGTYRDVEVTPGHPLFEAIGELQREPVTRVVHLEGLDTAAVAEFIKGSSELATTDDLVSAVWRATGGNPLFVGEVLRLLRAEGRLSEVVDPHSLRVAVPAGVRAVIARRIGHLDAAIRRVLELGAALGPEFTLDVLRRVAGLDIDPSLDLVDQASQAGLLQQVVGAPGRYRFSHDLVRETLYDELPPGRRARLHLQIAQVLEELRGGPSGGHLAELAFHYVLAASHGAGASTGGADDGRAATAGKAVDYARLAGDEATRTLAYEEAARMYAMALSVLDLDPRPRDDVRADLLLALGEAQARAADLDGARKAFIAAADIARRTGDGRQMARAALGYGGRFQWARPGRDAHLIPMLQDALVMLGGGEELLRARLLTRLAGAWRSSPERRDDCAALSRQAVEIARRVGDAATLNYALEGQFWATWWPENADERAGLVEECRTLARQLGDSERIVYAEFIVMLSHAERGDMAAARRELDTFVRLIDELRQPAYSWLRPGNRAWLALLDGEFELAEALVSEEQDRARPVTPARDDLSALLMHRFLLRREQGRAHEEVAALQRAAADFPWYPFHRAALVSALLDAGRTDEARAVFDDLARDDFAAIYRDNEWLFGMALASDACARLADAAAARILLDALLPFAGRHAISFAEGSAGALDRYLGLLAATLGELDAAVAHLERGIDSNDRMGARPWAAHSRHDLAEVLRQRALPGDADRAAELDRAALATARKLGMALVDQIDVGDTSDDPNQDPTNREPAGSAPSDVPPAATAAFGREGEFWTVVFSGETHRLRDSKGMTYLARLLAAPGVEIHALDLARENHSISRPVPSRRASESALDSDPLGPAGAALDAEAKAAYAERLRDIRSDLAEAEAWNDPERANRLREEEHFIARELAAAVGLGGRDRMVGSAGERARVSVTRAIRAALTRIGQASPALGSHLQATVRTGTFCSYVPDPRVATEWRL